MTQITSDHGLTIRQQVHAAMVTKLQAMQDHNTDVWQKVYDSDISDVDNTPTPCVGIDYGQEKKIAKIGMVSTYELPVMFPFRFTRNISIDVHDVYGYYLGLLQYALLGDHNIGGLTLNVEEDSNTTTIVGFKEIYPGGVLSTLITYRTRLNNPYARIGAP
jgi:hypothetical protein